MSQLLFIRTFLMCTNKTALSKISIFKPFITSNTSTEIDLALFNILVIVLTDIKNYFFSSISRFQHGRKILYTFLNIDLVRSIQNAMCFPWRVCSNSCANIRLCNYFPYVRVNMGNGLNHCSFSEPSTYVLFRKLKHICFQNSIFTPFFSICVPKYQMYV